jgi:hypothetical protein
MATSKTPELCWNRKPRFDSFKRKSQIARRVGGCASASSLGVMPACQWKVGPCAISRHQSLPLTVSTTSLHWHVLSASNILEFPQRPGQFTLSHCLSQLSRSLGRTEFEPRRLLSPKKLTGNCRMCFIAMNLKPMHATLLLFMLCAVCLAQSAEMRLVGPSNSPACPLDDHRIAEIIKAVKTTLKSAFIACGKSGAACHSMTAIPCG